MESNTFIPDYYAILEVSQSASSSAIKSAYNKLAFDATAKMQLVSFVASFFLFLSISLET